MTNLIYNVIILLVLILQGGKKMNELMKRIVNEKLVRWERNLRVSIGYESVILDELESMNYFKDKNFLIRLMRSDEIRSKEKAEEIRKLKIFYY